MKSIMSVALGAAVLVSGCATVVTGTRQDLAVTSTPAGAKVTADTGATCDATPCTLAGLHRGKPVTLNFALDGHAPASVKIESTSGGRGMTWVWGNLLLGGLIGLAVDVSTGALNTLSPNPADATLTPLPARDPEPEPARTEAPAPAA